jgi:hypothetical protein
MGQVLPQDGGMVVSIDRRTTVSSGNVRQPRRWSTLAARLNEGGCRMLMKLTEASSLVMALAMMTSTLPPGGQEPCWRAVFCDKGGSPNAAEVCFTGNDHTVCSHVRRKSKVNRARN